MKIITQETETQFNIDSLKIEQHASQTSFNQNAKQPEEWVVVCGWCKKIDIDQGNWKEIEEAVIELDLFKKGKSPQITHGICDDCFLKMSEEIPEKSRHAE